MQQSPLNDILRAIKQQLNQRKLQQYRPYGHPDTLNGVRFSKEDWSGKPWQLDFHNAGKDNKERLVIAGNGTGKSLCGAVETAYHLLGDYPDWWEGYRFSHAPHFWIGSITNEIQRDYVQTLLLGKDLNESLGTGLIPKNRIIGKPQTRQAGISGVVDTLRIRHASSDIAVASFKTYEQGWRKWQASAPDGIWMDEEPDEHVADQKDIFTEAQTRVFRTSGILYVTYTPLLGETTLTKHFMYPKSKGIYCVSAGWNDVAHLKEEDKQRLIATYPASQVATRTQGVVMMGMGAVFDAPEEDITVAPFDIPAHYSRIKGIDFGLDHPCAVADIAWDREKDIIYLTRTWRKRTADMSEHVQAINHITPWVPVSWPHDGTKRERSGPRIKDHYRDCKMLSKSACYDSNTLGSQPVEPIILEIQNRILSGRFKVFSDCIEFFDEYRSFHRDKNGKPIALHDDVLKAVFYAVMMRRYSTTKRSFSPSPTPAPIMVM